MDLRTLLACAIIATATLFTLGAEDAASSAGTDPAQAAPATETAASPFGFGISLGVDTLPVPGAAPGVTETYQRFGFKPDIDLGAFGVGLDLTLRAKIAFLTDNPFTVYEPDWIPQAGQTIFDVYLPKILFVRYGKRGEPLFVKLGTIDDLTLGNGFVMGNYSNSRFMPQTRIFGLAAGLDGDLFKFPWVGMETAIGNVARFDVFGGRLYIRPFASTSIPVVKKLEIGGQVAVDLQPYIYDETATAEQKTGAYAIAYDVDLRAPLIDSQAFPLFFMADCAFEQGNRTGAMTGFAGKLASLVTYGAQVRFLSPGFIPVYFDSNYDLYRSVKYESTKTAASGDWITGWHAEAGCDVMEGKVVFNAVMDGPFALNPATRSDVVALYPHIRASLGTAEGLLGGFSLSGAYEKYYLGRDRDFWSDMVSPLDAEIQAKLDYKTGAAVISLLYSLTYDPVIGDFDVSSSLQTTISF